MSIARKKKLCKECKLDKYIFGRGLCSSCYKKNYKPPKSKKKHSEDFREKGKQRNLEYKKAREEFLLTHDHCEVALEGCLAPYPTFDREFLQVHHKKGRIGSLLTDQKYFLCVCGVCHRFLEDNSQWAKDNGYSLSRLSI